MGYKGFIRSVNASLNASAKKSEQNRKRNEHHNARLDKKISELEDKKKKIIDALNQLLAKGQLELSEYDILKARTDDISLNLLVFGKQAGMELAKRYVCGKIDENEYRELYNKVMPEEVMEEIEYIKAKYEKFLDINREMLLSFKEHKSPLICQKCNNKQGIFRRIKKVKQYKICNFCKSKMKKSLQFKGISGNYFYIKSHRVKLANLEEPQLEVLIHEQHILI